LNFDFTDDQQAIKSTAHDFLAARFKLEKVRQLAEAGEYDEGIWKEMVELGWPGIFIGEEHGGQDLGVLELAILCEELGYALAPSPFLSNAAAGIVIQHAGSDEQKARWLPGIASGEQLATLAYVKDGTAALVPDVETASVVVFVEGGSANVIEAGEAEAARVDTIDSTRKFSRVEVPNGSGEALAGDASAAIGAVAVAISAELVGVSQRAMEMAVEYAKLRQQFGRPIGAYQAVSHRCAEMLLEVESARSATYFAAWAADANPVALPVAASVAKAAAADMGWKVAAAALQVHGGIGFTWEHDLHFFLKRAAADARMFGSASHHRDRVAGLSGLGLDAPEPSGPVPELAAV
jgi:alkylation response protein AidB-like acyl-CoA dehydrogenase